MNNSQTSLPSSIAGVSGSEMTCLIVFTVNDNVKLDETNHIFISNSSSSCSLFKGFLVHDRTSCQKT